MELISVSNEIHESFGEQLGINLYDKVSAQMSWFENIQLALLNIDIACENYTKRLGKSN